MSARRDCQRCGARCNQAKNRFCTKRCAALTQNERRRLSGDDERRFRANIEQRGPDECWPWLAGTCDGYGRIRYRGEPLGSHVVAYRLANGPVPAGMMVLHRCGCRSCCNPNHLYAGTHVDNTNDAIRHGTYKTVFVAGHPDFRRRAA